MNNIEKTNIIENGMYYFHNGYSCSESTLQAGIDYFNIETNCTPAVATAFGGGIKGLGHICGIVSGTLMLIGIMYGKKELTDSAEKVDSLSTKFILFCEEEIGTLMCRDLCGIDFTVEPYPSEKADKAVEENCVPALKKILQWQKEHL